jgi:histidinol-phosphatase (PHP family)
MCADAVATLPPDYHVHTALCRHAEGTPEEYVAHAARLGLEALCFTDHVPTPTGYDPDNRMALEDYPRYLELLRPFRTRTQPRVLVGVEADYHPGCEAYLRDWLPAQPFDLVLGSVHYIGDWGFDNPAELAAWSRADVTAVWREYFALLAALAATRLFDVVGHPDLPKKFGHRLPDATLRELAAPALDAVARAGMALELNTAGLRKAAREIYPSALFLGLAHEHAIPICFGSDAHRPQDVGAAFAEAVALARAAGYTRRAVYAGRARSFAPLPA